MANSNAVGIGKVLSNFNATVDPTTSNDNTQGYKVGSVWINTTTSKAYRCFDDSTGAALWEEIGAGSSGINYIDNPDAEIDTTGWSIYQDTSSSVPEDGAGGVPSVTITRNTSSPLRGDADFLLTKDAVNRRGNGFVSAFTIDDADKAKVLRISFDYKVASGTFNFNTGTAVDPSDLVVYIYDVTNAQIIQPTQFCLDGSGRFISEFQTSSNSTSYRLIIHVATANASAWTLQVDNVQVGPREIARGPVVTDWQSYTPTLSWVSGVSTNAAKWRRVGKNIEVRGYIQLNGAPTSAILTASLPSGLSFDSADLIFANDDTRLGYGTTLDGGVNRWFHFVNYNSSNSVKFAVSSDGTSGFVISNSLINQVQPFTYGFGDVVSYSFSAPIVGWSSNQVASSDFGGRVIAAQAVFTGTQNLSSAVLDLDSKNYDTTNSIDLANNRFVAPESGYYSIKGGAKVTVAGSTNFNADYAIRKNGSTIRSVRFTNGSVANDIQGMIAYETYLNANDYVDIYLTMGSAKDVIAQFLSVHKIQSPQTLMGGEVVAARATLNSGQSISNNTTTTLDLNGTTFDTHGIIDQSSDRITANVSGLYEIVLRAGMPNAGSGILTLSYRIDGTTSVEMMRVPLSSITAISHVASDLVKLNAGQYVEFRIFQNSGGSLTSVGGYAILKKVN